MNINNIVSSIKQTMDEKPNLFNNDKIDSFSNLNSLNNMNDKDKELLIHKIKCLKNTLNVFCDDEEMDEEFKQLDLCRLSLIYFYLVCTNKDKALSINDELVYLSSNCMRNIPIEKYNNCLELLTYPKFEEEMLPYGNKEKGKLIYSSLTRKFNNLNSKNIDEEMNLFLMTEVYTRIPKEFKTKEEAMMFGLRINKYYNIKNINNAKGNEKFEPKYNDKIATLDNYNLMNEEISTKYLEFTKYLENMKMGAFRNTLYEMTLLGIIKYIDITSYTNEQLFNLIEAKVDVKYNDYDKEFNQEMSEKNK